MRAKGIDISKWQVYFNYKGNIDFVIVKASEGLHWDPKHEHYQSHIASVPIRGAYHYFRTTVDPIMQAETFLDAILNCDYHFLAVDYEATGNTLDRQGADNLLRCLEHLSVRQDRPVLIYTSPYIYRDNLRVWDEMFDTFPVWIAKWHTVGPGVIIGREWDLWQWTSSADGEQAGVGSEFVDRNVYNGTIEQMKRWLGIEEDKMKAWYESKTIWVGIIEIGIAILGLAATFLEAGDYTAPAITLLVVGILKIALRSVSETAIE